MSDRYFVRQRLDWIAEMLRIYGFINRTHLIAKFEISPPQAATDFALFMKRHPGAMVYDASSKRYCPTLRRCGTNRVADDGSCIHCYALNGESCRDPIT